MARTTPSGRGRSSGMYVPGENAKPVTCTPPALNTRKPATFSVLLASMVAVCNEPPGTLADAVSVSDGETWTNASVGRFASSGNDISNPPVSGPGWLLSDWCAVFVTKLTSVRSFTLISPTSVALPVMLPSSLRKSTRRPPATLENEPGARRTKLLSDRAVTLACAGALDVTCANPPALAGHTRPSTLES